LAVLALAPASACGRETETRTETRTVTTTQIETVTQQAPTPPPPPRVFVPQHGSLIYKPDLIGQGVSNAIEDIRWTSYGGATAVGKGIFPSNDCTPSCADGTITRLPITVRLRDRILCRGALMYARIALEGRGFDNTYDAISDDSDC